MTDHDADLRARLAEAQIRCTEEELEVVLAGSVAARAVLERLWQVDVGDIPPFMPPRP